jgi:hypothetical protein
MSMDAREVIRHFLQGTDLSCDDLITALEWHGNRIVHHDENHGPTRDRAAEIGESMPGYMQPRDVVQAIRAMGEKK